MVNYRRNYFSGGTYFFTVTLQNRRANTLIEHVDSLRYAIRITKHKKPFKIIALVILPDHIHTIWQLPPNDHDYSDRWRSIKSRFTHSIIQKGVKLTKNHRDEYNLWQKRYWEHTIRNEIDLNNHINYIHYNPLKHGFVDNVVDWKYSSFHQYVQKGMLESNWGSNIVLPKGGFGE